MKAPAILVIDDDPMIRTIFKMYCNQQNFPVLEAENGSEALDILAENESIVHIVLDLNMPVLDGFSFLVECEYRYPARPLHIYIVSAYSINQFLNRVKQQSLPIAKVVDFIEKPSNIIDIINKIKSKSDSAPNEIFATFKSQL